MSDVGNVEYEYEVCVVVAPAVPFNLFDPLEPSLIDDAIKGTLDVIAATGAPPIPLPPNRLRVIRFDTGVPPLSTPNALTPFPVPPVFEAGPRIW
jgi:hypothetical protein